ncbi:MAG: hypothetical protein B6I36_01290 [Desulfobacteraceae bacterium 4572_35.1]|nr:MAG: hypothetical protein B6I36_01290 [Desulfobacteraceae bacterium 4572_35.1]
MVKRTLGLFLAALMLVPTCAFAAPSTADLAKQIEMLTQQLQELQAQVAEVQDASDDNADSVELLEDKSATWDDRARFEFFGDYRARLDYSDTDTKAYWGAMDIANAVNDMSNVMTAFGQPMNVPQIVGLMGNYTGAERKGMMENLPMSLAQMGADMQLRGMGMARGSAGYNAQIAGATQQAYTMITNSPTDPSFPGLGMNNTYSMTPKNNYKNDTLFTNRFRLGMKFQVAENLNFKGRLAMYKSWGNTSNPTVNGPYYFNSFPEMDGQTSRQPNDSSLMVDRAYINWTNIGGMPVWFSIGRRPTTDGPPSHIRLGTGKRMATPISFMDYAFDGASLGMVFDNPFDFMGYSKIRFCYGRGFEAGPLENGNNLDDMDFGGFSWDIINKGDRFANIQSFLASNIVNVPDGVTFANPLEIAMGTGNNILDTENLGDIFHTTAVYMDKVADLNYFVSAGWSRTDPDGVDEMGSTLLGSWWENPGQKDGYSVYAGVRYDLDDLGLKVGLEYNYGTKNWISMTPGHDDMTQAKLATRGHVGEIYAIYDLPVGELLSEKCKAFMRIGYQHYEYEYTGSGNWLGAPVDVDDLDDPLNAQFWAPIDSMDQAYLTMDVMF